MIFRIEFQDNHHYRDAVYLPEVASEQGSLFFRSFKSVFKVFANYIY